MRIRVLTLCFLAAVAVHAQSTPSNLSLGVEPATVSDGGSTELICRVTIPDGATSCSIDVQPPLGFKAEPRTITISGAAPNLVVERKVTLTPIDAYQPAGTKVVRADLFASAANVPIRLAAPTQQAVFAYESERLSIREYLGLGLVGIVVGYVLRLLINILKTIPAPTPLAESVARGRITAFVQRHYYWIDCLVTMALGMIVLFGFIKNDLPPDAGARWYGALVIGVEVGALTNSELLTRLIAGLPRSSGVAVTPTI